MVTSGRERISKPSEAANVVAATSTTAVHAMLETCRRARAGIWLRSLAWLLLSGCRSPGDAGEAAALVLATRAVVANGAARRSIGAARVLHRRGGRVAMAVSVGAAGGVPLRQSQPVRSGPARWQLLAQSTSAGALRAGWPRFVLSGLRGA